MDGVSPQEVVRIAASAERFSEHPLGKAIAKKAKEWSLDYSRAARVSDIPLAKASYARLMARGRLSALAR